MRSLSVFARIQPAHRFGRSGTRLNRIVIWFVLLATLAGAGTALLERFP
jgi:hypothetical protein